MMHARDTTDVPDPVPAPTIGPSRLERRQAVAAVWAVPAGVLLVAVAFAGSRTGAAWGPPLYWLGVITIVAPASAVLLTGRLTRGQTLSVLLAVGVGLFVVNTLRSPAIFTGYDELLHYRTLADVVRTRHLFQPNSLLPVSPRYPGLEIVTDAVVSATGLDLVGAGLLVVATARVLTVVSLFLLLERVAIPARLAGLGTLAYMAAPSFIAFDASFAYESLAIPLAFFCLFCLREAQLRSGHARLVLQTTGAAAMLAVVATHHVTSYILVGGLCLWTLAVALKHRPREPLPGGGWVPALGIGAVALWTLLVAPQTLAYLAPHYAAAMQEATRIVTGGSKVRKLFQSSGGFSSPPLERATGIASVLLIMAAGAVGVSRLVGARPRDAFARLLTALALGYPVLMMLRFTQSGWEIGARAMAFLYVPLGFVLAVALEALRSRFGGRWWTVAATAGAVVVFLGGVIAGTSPFTRMPRPYTPGAYSASIDGEGLAAAGWARTELGPERRFIADETNMTLMGSYGEQRVLNSTDHVSVSEYFLLPFEGYQRRVTGKFRIEYAVVDRRLAGVKPISGYFFEKWERQIADYGPVIEPWMLSRLDEVEGADRVFDSGGISIFDVRRLAR